MTLDEMKQKVYSLIEEYNEDADELTDDEDLAAKMNTCINMIMNELCRLRKLDATTTLDVKEGQSITMNEIDSDMYQLNVIRGVEYEVIGNTVIFNEEGAATIYYYKYPTQIKADTTDYTFELPTELLEIMPYGVAGLLLASDVSSNYGQVYTSLYENKKQLIDPRNATASVYISKGVNV